MKKNVTLSIARELKALLDKDPNFKGVLTRSSDTTFPYRNVLKSHVNIKQIFSYLSMRTPLLIQTNGGASVGYYPIAEPMMKWDNG